jgi:squalene synthase HpnC
MAGPRPDIIPKIQAFLIPLPVEHYENFPVASRLLPPALRPPVEAIYAFARNADDFADEGTLGDAERLALLDGYARSLERIARGERPDDPVFSRLHDAIVAHDLPVGLFHDLLDAFRQDVVKKRYATFDELMDYCRRSANPVGRLLLALFRKDDPANLRDSDAICSSLQLINHWQDIAVDWAKGRVYLPQEDLARFGVPESQIAAGSTAGGWGDLVRFQCQRARAMMGAGAPLGARLPGRLGLEIRAITAGGLRVLELIDAVDGDVFHRRPALRAGDRVRIVWRALFGRPAPTRTNAP